MTAKTFYERTCRKRDLSSFVNDLHHAWIKDRIEIKSYVLVRTPVLKYSYMLMTQKYIQLVEIRVIRRSCSQYESDKKLV